ncbi:C4-dicarboxylate ABC transporter permease [Meridianimarinicoccus roseus]|uniref:TRAP transporter small permease protein n=1 Tax=Meridianimarinicoccus roseus TaxID=2072018 RepID=A0A2V2LAS6_9RHOB|nr:TRAP transporter small permease [Meridianimarinicoccus roseus]PWR00761.1 C4-dicarboxylate ABC transporter permease [Meridianimarinicoccus roseus]
MKVILLTLSRTTEFIEKFVIITAILLMMVNSTANAIGRYAFGKSLFFSEELNQFLIVSVTFFGFAYAVRKGRNIRMTALYDNLGLRARKVILTVISLTTSTLLLFLAYQSVFYVLEIKELNRLSPALQFPVYIIYSVIPIGLFMASLQYLIAFIMNLTRPGAWHSYEIEDSDAEDIGV